MTNSTHCTRDPPIKHFPTFLPIFENPEVQFMPTITQVGTEYTNLSGCVRLDK